MHICHVTSAQFPPEEGIGNYVYGLSTFLIKKGHKVTIITRNPWKKIHKETIDGIEIVRIPFFPFYPFYMHIHKFFVSEFFRSVESQIDLVHVHSPLSPFINTKIPIVATIHTPMITDTSASFSEQRDVRSKIEKLMGKIVSYPIELNLLSRAEIITTVAKSVANELKEYGLEPSKLLVMENGVDTNIFLPLKNKTDQRYILFTGRLAQRKGLFDLMECAKYICSEYPDISFIIPGKGILLDKLKQRAEKLNLTEKIKFVGFVDRKKLIQLYQNALIYILPSHYEGLPTVLLEAMSCGLPVIATAVSGNLDVISSGENGILIPPKSPKKMAESLSLLLNDEKMRGKLGKNARITIEKEYSWEVITDKYLTSYQSLVNI